MKSLFRRKMPDGGLVENEDIFVPGSYWKKTGKDDYIYGIWAIYSGHYYSHGKPISYKINTDSLTEKDREMLERYKQEKVYGIADSTFNSTGLMKIVTHDYLEMVEKVKVDFGTTKIVRDDGFVIEGIMEVMISSRFRNIDGLFYYDFEFTGNKDGS